MAIKDLDWVQCSSCNFEYILFVLLRIFNKREHLSVIGSD